MIYVALLVLMACLVIGVPVPVSFMASAAWLIFFGGPDGMGYEASQLLPYGFTQMNSVSLIAIAMFIMAGVSWISPSTSSIFPWARWC